MIILYTHIAFDFKPSIKFCWINELKQCCFLIIQRLWSCFPLFLHFPIGSIRNKCFQDNLMEILNMYWTSAPLLSHCRLKFLPFWDTVWMIHFLLVTWNIGMLHSRKRKLMLWKTPLYQLYWCGGDLSTFTPCNTKFSVVRNSWY